VGHTGGFSRATISGAMLRSRLKKQPPEVASVLQGEGGWDAAKHKNGKSCTMMIVEGGNEIMLRRFGNRGSVFVVQYSWSPQRVMHDGETRG
jgi:hypothetical protein